MIDRYKELEEAQNKVEAECNLLVQKSENLSWWDRNFTHKYNNLRQEVIDKWHEFERWQNYQDWDS